MKRLPCIDRLSSIVFLIVDEALAMLKERREIGWSVSPVAVAESRVCLDRNVFIEVR
jgi:hypothetical protein